MEIYSGNPLYEDWTFGEALNEIEENFINKDCIFILASERENVVGFCWGILHFAELGVKKEYKKEFEQSFLKTYSKKLGALQKNTFLYTS